jgi:hypothetical protein
MQDSNDNVYDSQGYEFPTLPYIPYASSSLEKQSSQELPPQYPANLPAMHYGESWSSLTETPPFIPTVQETEPGQISTEPVPAVPPENRRRRPKLWVLLGAIIAVLVLASVATFAIVSYINRSTPVKTLDAFCSALQRQDYPTAYNQFSKQLQSRLDETVFADILSQDKVISCTHGTADDSKTSATTSLKLVHVSKGVNNDLVTLTKQDNNEWKINDLQQA